MAGPLWETAALLLQTWLSFQCMTESVFFHSPTPINPSQNLLYNIYKGIYWCIQRIVSYWSLRLDCSLWAFDERFKRSRVNNIGICQREKDRLWREDVMREDTDSMFRTRQCQRRYEWLGESMRANSKHFQSDEIYLLESHYTRSRGSRVSPQPFTRVHQLYMAVICQIDFKNGMFCLHFCLFLMSQKR